MCEEKRRLGRWVGCVLAAVVVASSAAADFIDIGFAPVTSNSGIQDSLATQFNVRVELGSGANAGRAAFTFSNEGAIEANIAELYWDWPDVVPWLLAPSTYFNYSDPSGDFWELEPPDSVEPGHVPGGGAWSTNAAADGDAPGDTNGNQLQKGLWTGEDPVTFYIAFAAGVDEADKWDLLSSAVTGLDPALRFGLHVRSINGVGVILDDEGGFPSDSFISTSPPVVPVPGAAALGILGLGIVALRHMKRSKSDA